MWIGAYQKTTNEGISAFSELNEYVTGILHNHFRQPGKLLPKVLITMIDPDFGTGDGRYMNGYLSSLKRILEVSFERYAKKYQRKTAPAEESGAMNYKIDVVYPKTDYDTSSITLTHIPTGRQIDIIFFPFALDTSYHPELPEVLTDNDCFTQLPKHGLSYATTCQPISDNWVELFQLLTNYLISNHKLYVINTAYIYGSNDVYHEQPDDIHRGQSTMNVYYDTFCEMGFMMDYWMKQRLGHLVWVNCPNCINPFHGLKSNIIPLMECETFK
jgi:hypothetical protein